MKQIAILAVLAGAWSGCTPYNKSVAPPAEQTVAERNFDAIWNASRQVLRDYRFEIASQSRRDGTIITAPLVGKQALEFWRKDAVTPAELAEDTFQTVYKTATVTIRPSEEDPEQYVASVAVEASRSDKPAMTVTSTSEAYGLFTMTGERNPWLTNFGRATDEAQEERAEKKSSAQAMRASESQPTSRQGPRSERWQVTLGRDGPLERQMTADIARAAARPQAAGK
jgi:hypothetical protein